MRCGQTITPRMLRPDTVGHGIKNSTSFRWHELGTGACLHRRGNFDDCVLTVNPSVTRCGKLCRQHIQNRYALSNALRRL
jgi:hypothetical protein